MLSLLIRPLPHILRILKGRHSPAHVASGIAIGAVLGWMPMDNLIAFVLGMLLCGLRVNKSAGVLAAMVFLWVGSAADPLADAIGLRLLGIGSLQGVYAWCYDLPLGPWIGFHNTVVLGSFVLGIYFAFPIYWLSYAVCFAVQQSLARWSRRRELRRLVANLKVGAEWRAAA